ncbi:21622_t:CDS:10 [Cetraspora pellucida]|uniref:21622_t:CDS:1 n=1 Tax=Cetraspora pellucida TaxID=1433469 RepID=A0A9N9ADP7_9GLOM|nr:21622_t:CDS:10 [Cetraspora pellucida]
MLLNRWKEPVHLKRVVLSLLVVLYFLIIASDARVLTNSYNEIEPLTVAQADTYPDDTIIILLKSTVSGSCGDPILHFRIITKDGAINKCDFNLSNNNNIIPLNNFCFQNNILHKRNYQEYGEDCDNENEPKKQPEHPDKGSEVCTTTQHAYESKPTEHPEHPDDKSEDCTTTSDSYGSKPTGHPSGKKDCDDGSENCGNDCKQSKEDCEKGCDESDENCKKGCSDKWGNCEGTSPGGGPGQTPNGGQNGTTPNGGPGQTPNGGPGQTPNGGPGQTPNGGPGQTPNGGPGQTPNGGQNGTTPNSGPGQTPNGQNGTTPNSGQNGTTPNSGQNGTTPNSGQNGTIPNSGQNGTIPNANGTTTAIPFNSNGPIAIPRSKSSSYSTINIYALTRPFVLVTYYCNYPQSYQMCGIIIDWSSNNVKGNVIYFGEGCSATKIVKSYKSDGFLYTCYNSTTSILTWTPYTLTTDGTITYGTTSHSSEITHITDMTQFPKYINIFPTENGDYGLVYTKYVSQSGQGMISPWQLYLIWISHTDSSTKGNSLIYESQPSTNTTDYYLYQCSVAQESVGYNCLIYTQRTDKTVYVNINFWSSGSVNKTTEFGVNLPAPYTTVIDVETLSYGGYIFVAKNTTNATDVGSVEGFIYYSNGTGYGPWGLPPIITTVPIIGLSPNNTVWTIIPSANNTNNSSSWTVESSDTLTNFRPAGMLGSAYVSRVTPVTNSVITPPLQEVIITYTSQVNKSTGFFRIWEVNTTGGDDSLRGSIPAYNDRVKINNENVTVSLLSSYTSSSHKEYYITVDDDAVKNPQDQNLIGIKKLVWNFTTSDVTDTTTGDRSVIIRLTPEGTQHYVNLSPNDKSSFCESMRSDIATVINCDTSRIKIPTLYQYSNYNNTGAADQIFMRVNIAQNAPSGQSAQGVQGTQGDNRGGPSLANDLNDVIVNKDISAISTGTTSKYIDQNNGAWLIPDLWNRYKYILIGVFVGLALLSLLWCLTCCKSNREEAIQKRRKASAILGFLTIFVSTLIVVDLVLDILFIVFHGKDEKWIMVVSVVFLVVPVACSTLLTFLIVSRELRENDRYKRWWKDHSYTALALTMFSGIDNEALNVASSHFAGYRSLNAPYTQETDQRIIMSIVFIMFIEDVPQFIYLIIYQKVTIIPAIVPILALSSCTILIFIRVISIIYLAFFCERNLFQDYEEEVGEKDSIENGVAPPKEPTNGKRREEPPALLVDIGSGTTDKNGKNGRSPISPGETRLHNLSDDVDRPIGKFTGESHKAALMAISKNGKNGSTPRSPVEVEAHRSDLSTDIEKPIGKYTESQIIDSPSTEGHFETRITQYTDEHGVTHTRREQIFIPEVETTTTVHEENIYIDSPDIHRSQTQMSQDGYFGSQVTRDESVTYELPDRTGTPTTTSSTTTAHGYIGGQDIRSTPTTTSTFTTHEYFGSPGGTQVIRTIRDPSGEVTEQHTQEFQGEPRSDVHTHTSRTEETHIIPGGTETIITTETTETETETEYEESSQTQTFSHTKTNK